MTCGVRCWVTLAVLIACMPAATAHAQEWGYMDITVELVEQRWQHHDEDAELLVLELAVTNNEGLFLYGKDVHLDVVIVGERDSPSYPVTYWRSGPMAESCPEDVGGVAPGRTSIWNVCFKIPAGEKPDFLRIYDQPASQIIQFRTYSASCHDMYGELCASRTLDGGINAGEYAAVCRDVIGCWSAGLAILLDYVMYLEELVDNMAYEMDVSGPADHRTTIQETEIQWEFLDSKGNFYTWTLPVSAYEDAVVESRLRSTVMGFDPLYLNNDGETITTINLDGFVRGSFGKVIGDIYDNSRSDADFVREVWYVASRLTVYDEDVDAGSEGRYATETFSRGGGDCEDLVILIADMLVSSEHTEGWTIRYVYMDADNPTDLREVNHVILYVDDGRDTHLIEATGEPGHDYYPDGVNGWFIDVVD